MAAFSEERLDMGVDYGSDGGPGFSTSIIAFPNGFEARNSHWAQDRGQWQLGQRVISKAKLEYIQAFFRVRSGSFQGFRFKDWCDWQAKDEALVITGAKTAQLIKTYSSGADSQQREIKKPVGASVSLTRNGGAYSAALDSSTGIVTFSEDVSKNVSAITQANPGQATVNAHGFSSGDEIYLSAPVGMTEVNDQVFTITVVDANNFTLGVDTSGYSAYSSGVTAKKFPQSSENIRWSGEFDVPVRFDTDQFKAQFDAYDDGSTDAAFFLSSLPVVEVRVDN